LNPKERFSISPNALLKIPKSSPPTPMRRREKANANANVLYTAIPSSLQKKKKESKCTKEGFF
jgi:hypothetical protein